MSREHKALSAIAAAVILITLWVHWPCVQNEFLHWDDETYLEKAIEVQPPSIASVRWAFTTIYFGNYHPLTWLSYIVDWRIWGRNAAGHHATSVVLHAANAGLVVLFAWMLLRTVTTLSVGQKLAAAAAVGLVFGIHPLQVESVAWIAQRKTVLCGFFSLASLCTYLWYTQRPQARGRLWAATALFVAALLSKAMAISLPVVMLALDYYPLRRSGVGWRQLLSEKVMFFAMAAAVSGITLVAQMQAEAVHEFGRLGLLPRFLMAMDAIVYYLWKLLVPTWLSPCYPLENWLSKRAIAVVISVASVIFVTIVALRERRRTVMILAWWSAYIAMILPVSGLVQTGLHAVADRFMYLAILPSVILLASGLVWMWRHAEPIWRAIMATLLIAYAAALGTKTRLQIPVWKDDATLWSAAVRYFPDSGNALYMLAQALIQQRRFREAEPVVRRGVEVSGGHPTAYGALGLILLKTGRYDEAVAQLHEALSRDSDLVAARYNLACAYSRLGQLDRAYPILQLVLTHEPKFRPLAVRDPDLTELRQNAQYAEQFQALVAQANE